MTAQKLLVADDSVTIQKVIRLALANEGYEIQAVADGNDALQQIALIRPNIVLIDVALPGRDAFEVKRAINEDPALGNVHFVLMSSAFEKVDETQACEVQFDARLTKPFDPATLREILAQLRLKQPTKIEPDNTTTIDIPLDDDIRRLTESTIRISGLENFDTIENSLELEPPPSPQPPELPQSPEEAHLDLPRDEYAWSVQGPTLQPDEKLDIPFSFDSLEPMNKFTAPPPLPTAPSSANPPSLAEAMAISEKEIEKIVSVQVEHSIRKLTQETLPSLMEKIIKDEIHRLLSDQH